MIPLHDVLFKYLFGNEAGKRALKNLCESFVGEKYDSLKMLDSQVSLVSHTDKGCRLDLFVDLEIGKTSKRINLEAQLKHERYLWQRLLYYWTRAFSWGFKKGDNYDKLRESIVLVFLDGKLDRLPRAIRSFSVREDVEPHNQATKFLRMICVELPKFRRKNFVFDFQNPMHCWVKFLLFYRSEDRSQFEEVFQMNQFIKETAMRYDLLSDEEKEYYQFLIDSRTSDIVSKVAVESEKAEKRGMKKGYAKGIEKGQEEGYAKAQSDMVKRIYTQTRSVSETAKISGLDEKMIKEMIARE
ncbi:MAG: PD-(D/E)XK nuclease family transposase [Bacilli bacterium]